MKITKLLTIASILLLFSNCTENNIKNDLTKDGWKGRVKSVKTTYYEVTEKLGEIIKGKSQFSTKRIYNKQGNVTEEIDYESNEDSNFRTVYKYDGNKKQESIEYSNGNVSSRLTYVYDKKGNISEEKLYFSDGDIFKTIYKYDSKGNLIEKKEYDSDGEIYRKTVFEYDEKERLEITSNYFSDGDLMDRTTYKTRDEKGGVSELSYYDSLEDKSEEITFKVKYDKMQNNLGGVQYINGVPTLLIEREIEYY